MISARPLTRATPLGLPLSRVEDGRFLSGEARYVGDLVSPRMLHAAFVRSPHAHAAIESVEIEAALRVPGVVAVLTGNDTAGLNPLVANVPMPGLSPTPQPVLPSDRVRFVGQAVAIVIADDRYIAEDGVDVVRVDYAPLPAVTSVAAAMADGAPVLFEELGTNIIYRQRHTRGDVEAAFANCAHRFARTYQTNRFVASPMEGRGCLAAYEPAAGRLTFWSSTQMPHLLRWILANALGLPEIKVHAIAPDVGGAFGQKMTIYPEEIVVAFAACHLERPVRWVEDRRENLMAATHAKEQTVTLEAAVDADGALGGIWATFIGDAGAFSFNTSSALIEPGLAGPMLPGPYRLENYTYDVLAAVTNKSPVGPYRGVGWTAAQTARELLFEEIAGKLALDPAEFRRRNMIRPEEMPYRSCTDMVYDSGDYLGALEKALDLARYTEERLRQAEGRRKGCYIGIGISPFIEQTGGGTDCGVQSGMPYPSHDNATVTVDLSGKVRVATGLCSQGQGHETTFAQVVAEAVGVDVGDVAVVGGDSETSPFGMGTWASRSAVVGSGAVWLAGGDVRSKILAVAAEMLETEESDVSIASGLVSVQSDPSRCTTLAEVALRAYFDASLAPEARSLTSTRFYDPTATYSNGCIVAVCEVDAGVGTVRIVRLAAVEDCGMMLNPAVVDGQLRGAIAQGVGGALMEEIRYDDDGQLLTASFLDYVIPTAAELPRIEIGHTEHPSPYTPLGVKGMGESGLIAAPAAVACAVLDALRPLGVEIGDLPLDPSRVLGLIEAADRTTR